MLGSHLHIQKGYHWMEQMQAETSHKWTTHRRSIHFIKQLIKSCKTAYLTVRTFGKKSPSGLGCNTLNLSSKSKVQRSSQFLLIVIQKRATWKLQTSFSMGLQRVCLGDLRQNIPDDVSQTLKTIKSRRQLIFFLAALGGGGGGSEKKKSDPVRENLNRDSI